MTDLNQCSAQDLDELAAILQKIVIHGLPPEDLPARFQSSEKLIEFARHLSEIQNFSQELANGSLSTELKVKGRTAGALKSLQANLRHLTWQTQCIARGDLSQRVDFMGEFSEAFNHMVESLQQARADLVQRARELAEQRRLALEQLEEIRGLQEQLREQAIRDPLTGLYNRRYLMETMPRELARAEREEYPVVLIMLDIDRFKSINDTHGHQAGDHVLQELGTFLRRSIRKSDVACRYGGEEFLVLLPGLALPEGADRADELRQGFVELGIKVQETVIQATFSAGVACFPDHGAEMDKLIASADAALYGAKISGRNRVEVGVL